MFFIIKLYIIFIINNNLNKYWFLAKSIEIIQPYLKITRLRTSQIYFKKCLPKVITSSVLVEAVDESVDKRQRCGESGRRFRAADRVKSLSKSGNERLETSREPSGVRVNVRLGHIVRNVDVETLSRVEHRVIGLVGERLLVVSRHWERGQCELLS